MFKGIEELNKRQYRATGEEKKKDLLGITKKIAKANEASEKKAGEETQTEEIANIEQGRQNTKDAVDSLTEALKQSEKEEMKEEPEEK